jgi:hypothetical protein
LICLFDCLCPSIRIGLRFSLFLVFHSFSVLDVDWSCLQRYETTMEDQVHGYKRVNAPNYAIQVKKVVCSFPVLRLEPRIFRTNNKRAKLLDHAAAREKTFLNFHCSMPSLNLFWRLVQYSCYKVPHDV